ncbi:Hypothetical predicted protein, partial [Pelobates cultripes]
FEDSAWLLDRAHRLPRPARFSADTPKDVIARLHYYGSKEQLMTAAWKISNLPEPYQSIQIFAESGGSQLSCWFHTED